MECGHGVLGKVLFFDVSSAQHAGLPVLLRVRSDEVRIYAVFFPEYCQSHCVWSRLVPELIRRWNEQPNKSLLETFQTVLPRSNWSCLFKA